MFDFLLLAIALLFLIIIYCSHHFNYKVDSSNYALKLISYQYYFLGFVSLLYFIFEYVLKIHYRDIWYINQLRANLWVIAFLINIIIMTLYFIAVYKDINKLNLKNKDEKQILLPFLITGIILLTNLIGSIYIHNDNNHIFYKIVYYLTITAVLIYYNVLGVVLSHKLKYRRNYNLWKCIIFSIGLYSVSLILQLYINSVLLFIIVSIFTILVLQLYMQFVKRINDRLTNLYNAETLRLHVSQRTKLNQKFSIVLYSIANFKMINKYYGLTYGDETLKEVANKFIDTFKDCKVYRYSGDEFAIIIDESNILYEQKLHHMYHKLTEFFSVNNPNIVINMLYAKVDYPVFGTDAEQLFLALEYIISSQKKGNIQTNYSNDIKVVEKLHHENYIFDQLKQAINNDGFEVYYQPIYDVKNNNFSHAEALLRMKDTSLHIYPNEFIPIAEDRGLLIDITYIVLEKVCKNLRELIDIHGEEMELESISVNFSYTHFLQPDIISKVNEILNKYKILPNRIKIELTERALIEDGTIISKVIHKMQQLGYIFELDDFGVEYSNLNVFLNLDIDIIKIDRSLVLSAFTSEENKQFFEHIMYGIKATGRKVIIEGVEESNMLALLFSCGCDYIQGYYFSKPLPYIEYFNFVFNKPKHKEELIQTAIEINNNTRKDTSKYECLEVSYSRLQDEKDHLECALNSLENPVFIKNSKAEFVFLNESYKRYFNIEDDSVYLNKSVQALSFLPYEDRLRYQQEDIELIRKSKTQHYKQEFTLTDGSIGTSLYWSKGFSSKKDKGLIGEIVDITNQENLSKKLLEKNNELTDAYEKIKALNEYDNLTGIYNRSWLERIIDKPNSDFNFNQTYVIKADLCMFSTINSKYGRKVADEVLLQFTEILKNNCSINDKIIRYDGEVFIIFIHGFVYDKAIAKINEIMQQSIDTIETLRKENISIKYGMTRHINDEPLNTCINRVTSILKKAKSSKDTHFIEEY